MEIHQERGDPMTKMLLVSLIGLFVAAPPQKPGKSGMKIRDTGRPELRLEPSETTTHYVFEPLFTHPMWAPMRPYALVLTNKTSRAIIGLAVRWKYSDGTYPQGGGYDMS